MYLAQIDRISRSLLTLNRDREYTALKRMLALSATDTMLDVGSGDGFWTARLAKHCARVVGLEPDGQTLGYARTLHNRPNVLYVRGAAESLPFRDSAFDKVVSVSCLEHFADPLQGLREMTRVLKPTGRVALSVDSLLPENSPVSFREWHRHRHFVTHYFNQDELLTAMRVAGLHCEFDHTVHLFRARAAAHLRQIFIRRPRFWLPVFPLFYSAVRLADWISDDMHGQIIIVSGAR
jgi:SAM-dependent methyltransferase